MRHEAFHESTKAAAAKSLANTVAPIAHYKDGRPLSIDMLGLRAPHTFIQGGTGAGKTLGVCRKVESAVDQGMPFTIIDVEDQFSPLAETYPDVIVIATEGTKVKLDVETIGAVATEAFRNHAPFIVKIDDLTPPEQQKVVAEIAKALMAMPRKDWAKRLFVVDEVHLFAPQQGKTESSAPLAELAARGRKRGYYLVFATQRFSRTAKDCTSQCHNLYVGLNTKAGEIDRATVELGLSKHQAGRLSKLKPGTFFATGPDISDEIAEVTFEMPRTRLDTITETESALGSPVLEGAELVDALCAAANGVPYHGSRVSEEVAESHLASIEQMARCGAETSLESAVLGLFAGTRFSLAKTAVRLLLRQETTAASIDTAIASLRRRGLVSGRKRLSITAAGRKILNGDGAKGESFAERLGNLRASLEPDALRILDTSFASDQPLSLDEIARRTGFTSRSRRLRNCIDKLSRRGLVSKRGNLVMASAGYRALSEV